MASKVSGLVEYIKPGGSNATQHAIASTAYGYCETAASEQIKDVDMTGFILYEGVTVHIKFKNKNSASDPKLRINSTAAEDAKPIVQYGTTAAGATSETNGWYAGAVISFTYDGTSWVRDQGFNTNTTYYYESCYSSTGASTAAKVAQASAYTLPTTAGHFAFWLLNSNTAASKLTLAIKNGSTAGTAKDIWINGAVTSSTNYTWPSGFYIGYYDGSVYHFRTDGKLPGSITGDAATVNGLTVQTAVPANAVFTDTKSFTITANATDGYWDLTGTNGTNAVTYALAPYSSKQSGANFYTGTDNPDGTTRLNYNGYLYATKYISSLSPGSWIDGQRYVKGAYNILDYSNKDSYNPWIRATNTWASGASNAKQGRWFSFGTLGTSFYWMGSNSTRTENSYDYALCYDTSNGYLYASMFSGSGTNITLGTASRAVITDSNKKLAVSSVTSTELGYVSGVTSAIQTQLNGKMSSSTVVNTVKQTAKTDNVKYKLLACANSSPTSGTNYEAVYDAKVYVNPSLNQIAAGQLTVHDKAATPVEKVTLQWNSTDLSLDFIFI